MSTAPSLRLPPRDTSTHLNPNSPVCEPASAPVTARALSVALAGPAALGAIIGLKLSLGTALMMGLTLPLVCLGVGVMTLPGFYVACSLLGIVPRAQVMGRIAVWGARDLGLVMLGLSPAMLLVIASLSSVDEAVVVGSLGVVASAMFGARALFHRLMDERRDMRLFLVFLAWMVLSAGLGWELYLMALRLSGGLP